MEYRSPAGIFGLPLIHVATGHAADGTYRRGIVIGWIAIGDRCPDFLRRPRDRRNRGRSWVPAADCGGNGADRSMFRRAMGRLGAP